MQLITINVSNSERHKEEAAVPEQQSSESKITTMTEDYSEIADEEGDYSTPASKLKF